MLLKAVQKLKHRINISNLLVSTREKSSCQKKESVVMNKLLSRGNKRKKLHWVTPPNHKDKIKESAVRCTPRRVTVLNKLFMQHVTDIMATGSASTDLVGLNIEITNVCITNDYKILNVFWTSTGSVQPDSALEQKLVNAGKILRHDITQLWRLGNIPQINFIKDKKLIQLNEVLNKLNEANFSGPLSSEAEHIKNLPEKAIPSVQTNVFGLDRAKIMNKITSELKRRGTKSKSVNITGNVDTNEHRYKEFIIKFTEYENKKSNRSVTASDF